MQQANAFDRATDYPTWIQAAVTYDRDQGLDAWRNDEESPFYPHQLLKEQIWRFREYRRQRRPDLLLPYLHESLHRTLGELSDPHLYSVSRVGTKHLIENYLDEVEATLEYLCDTGLDNFDQQTRQRIFRNAGKIFGESALMLSGGGTFGIYHLGIIRAMLQLDLLPRVISGTSMGAFIAGVVGTHDDQQLKALLDHPESIYCDALQLNSPRRMWSQRAIFDADQLSRCIRTNMPEMTFLEAYQHTGRITNIAISPTRAGQKPRILNFKTAPNVLISSACLASCAIPFLFPPSQLLAKSADQRIVPYMASEFWADGSVNHDIPMARVARLHNVNHFIVSQTNPHILLLIANREREGVLAFFADLTVSLGHGFWHQLITVCKKRVGNRALRFWLDRADAMLGQDYLGDINIHPDFPLLDYLKVMKNPTPEGMRAFVRAGEKAVWPKLAMIRNQTRISRVLQRCNQRLKGQRTEKAA